MLYICQMSDANQCWIMHIYLSQVSQTRLSITLCSSGKGSENSQELSNVAAIFFSWLITVTWKARFVEYWWPSRSPLKHPNTSIRAKKPQAGLTTPRSSQWGSFGLRRGKRGQSSTDALSTKMVDDTTSLTSKTIMSKGNQGTGPRTFSVITPTALPLLSREHYLGM